MSLGNPDKGLCYCGQILRPINWCEADRCECSPSCPSHGADEVDCVIMKEMLRCPRCETVVEVQE